MKPRDLKAIFKQPQARRMDIIAEGLDLLTEHIDALHGSMLQLGDGESGRRGATVIEAFASEEAAKVLILLDLARMGWGDEAAAARQVGFLYSHLARGIYVRHYGYRPADFAEVRRYVEDLRQQYYLDGPNDADFIFRNEIEANREDALYVDYVTDEDGNGWWTTPATGDDLGAIRVSEAVEVALALHQFGATSRHGLDITSDVWRPVEIDDSTHWSEVRATNERVLEQLQEAGLWRTGTTEHHAQLALDSWSFPLGGLDLKRSRVDIEDLKALREQLDEAALAREIGSP